MNNGCSDRLRFTSQVKIAPPAAPNAPPIPTTVEMLVEGNISPGVVKMLADQPWCAAVARQNKPIAGHALPGNMVCICGTAMIGTTQSAVSSIAVLRPKLTE